MLAYVLTKPLQGQKFGDMRTFLQNCSRNYDDDLEQEEDEQGWARQSMNHQVKTNSSSWECVEEQQKLKTYQQLEPYWWGDHKLIAQLA